VRKDLKTAVRVLAQALQCSDPQHCPLEQYNQPLPTLYRLVEDYLSAQGKSAHTIRNAKNNLSRLFRLAEKQQLFSLTPPQLSVRYNARKIPNRPGSPPHTGTYLSLRQWPRELQDDWTAFVTWATLPLVPGRDASLKKRLTTIENYKHHLESYFGYLHHTLHIPALTFNNLFDISFVTRYVQWHINILHKRPTLFIKEFLTHLLVLIHQYRPQPELEEQLVKLQKTIPRPYPLYNKEDAWVPLKTIDAIGRAQWPTRPPKTQQDRHPGIVFAAQAGIALMLRLWCYVPLRQRNMREMLLDTNLAKDTDGKWRITFKNDQLKIATKRGKPNIFQVAFPHDLVPVLKEYLSRWRPILLARTSQDERHVFLKRNGQPYDMTSLWNATRYAVYSYTEKRWHPHIIRTVWATEMIRNGMSFLDVAYMLNDRPETVIAKYAHLRDEDVAEKSYSLVETILSRGK
jgi:hypothetical protein